MSNIEPPDAPPRKGKMKRILGLTVGACVLAGAGFGAGTYMAGERPSPSDEVLRLLDRANSEENAMTDGAGEPSKKVKALPEEELFQTSYYEFPDPLTTNLKGSRRFAQIGIGVSTQYDETVIQYVETHAMALRSDMLAILGGVSEEEITGKEGRDALAIQLRDAMNARLESLEGFGGIEDVFFPSFVLQ